MHRRRIDAHGRFLPNHPDNRGINPYEALDVNPFAALYQALDNVDYPAFELPENNLHFLFGPPEENHYPLVVYQGSMVGRGGGANPPGGGGNPPGGGNPSVNPTFEFPISNLHDNANLKNIPTSSLPKFYGLVTEELDTFLFEFDVLCRSYLYTIDAYRLKIFPATLKEFSLRWFMSLGSNSIDTWEEIVRN